MLVWYADLDALKVCQDLRKACPESTDKPECRTEVRDCVRPVLEQAFVALCEEHVASCEEQGAPERPCARVHARCDAKLGNDTGDQNSDAGVKNDSP